MSDNEVKVTIVGDASGVAPAISLTKDELTGLGASLAEMTAGFAELSALMRESMAAGTASTAEMAGEMKVLIGETEKESLSLKSVAMSAREGAEAMIGMRESLMGFGELIMAAFAVEAVAHFSEMIGGAAEKTYHLSQQFGLTVGQVQGLAAATAATGIPLDSLTKSMGILDKNFEMKPKLFSDLGIEIPKNADQMQVLNAVMDKFANTADGPNKTAMALVLMGRAGKELIPFLNEGSNGLAELITKAKEYGAVNEEATAKGVKLAESLNEGKLAMLGLKQTLTDAFAPLLTEVVDGFNNMVKAMTESYNAGGTVKIVFEAIVEIFHAVGDILSTVYDAFAALFTTGATSKEWGQTVKAVIDAIAGGIKLFIVIVAEMAMGLKIAFEEIIGYAIQWYGNLSEMFDKVGNWLFKVQGEFTVFGTVVQEALSLNWGAISTTWDQGMAGLDQIVRARGAQIVADAKATSEQAQGWLKAAAAGQDAMVKFDANVNKPKPPTPSTGIKLHGGSGGEGGDLSKAGKKDPKEKKPKDDLVQKLEEELTAKKTAWAMEQDAQGTAQQYSIASEADYWKQILARTDLSAKDRMAVEQKYLAAHSQIVRERLAIEIEGYKQELSDAGNNAAEKLALGQKQLKFIKDMYGEESREARQAADEVRRLQDAAERQTAKLADMTAQAERRAALEQINEAEKVAKFRVEMGQMTAKQLLAAEVEFENQRFAVIEAEIAREKLAAVKANDPEAKKKALIAEEEAYRAHQSKLTELDRQGIAQRLALEHQAINQVGSLWGQNIAQLVTLQQGFATTIGNLYKGMVGVVSDALAQILEKWIVQKLESLLFHKSEVAANAAVAGSGAYAATAMIPVVGPALAPAAAAGAYAGAMSFMAMSAEGGDWNVTPGMYELHKDEMVLPAWAAQPLRSMLTSGGDSPANNNGKPAANDGGGGFHYHDHTERGVSAGDIMKNRAALAKAVKMAHREGRFGSLPIGG